MIDDLRARFPHLGFSVYALTPGAAVTVEVLTPDGTLYGKEARTEREAFLLLFPELDDDTQEETDAPDTSDPADDIFS